NGLGLVRQCGHGPFPLHGVLSNAVVAVVLGLGAERDATLLRCGRGFVGFGVSGLPRGLAGLPLAVELGVLNRLFGGEAALDELGHTVAQQVAKLLVGVEPRSVVLLVLLEVGLRGGLLQLLLELFEGT